MRASALWVSALSLIGAATATATVAATAEKRVHVLPRPPGVQAYDHPDPQNGLMNGTFEQLLDHNDPSKGTFSQRFWFDTQYWKGPGSPVFLFMPGEQDASRYLGYLHETTLPGLYGKTFGGLVILIERRFSAQSACLVLPSTELTFRQTATGASPRRTTP
ncbi:serine-type peptidase [Niveomyces insectorum RCEF 264]|uniref:Serine-type peptidase n=1 Tax=Niveomyces insectorum RCEF 264 TaxID=1081102 RepID=A0A162IGS6_9HYPO|nr:serine-type peptidase [Niveomyces insectorum RCEF 264]